MTEKDKQIQDQAIRIRELEKENETLVKLVDRLCDLCMKAETPESPYKAWKLMRDEHESTDS